MALALYGKRKKIVFEKFRLTRWSTSKVLEKGKGVTPAKFTDSAWEGKTCGSFQNENGSSRAKSHVFLNTLTT